MANSANDLAKLVARLELESAQWHAKFDKADARLAKHAANTKQVLGKIRKQFADFGANIARSFAIGSVTAAFYGLTRAVGSAIQAGDDLAKFAAKSGIAAEAASQLAHAAKMADVDLVGLGQGIRFMQTNLSKIGSSDGKEAEAILDAIGLSAKTLKNLKPEEQFLAIGDAIKRLPRIEDQTRAWQFFGKAGLELAPAFEEGAAGIRAAMEEAKRLGKSFSAEDLKKFQDADDAFKRMAAAGSGLAGILAIKLEPAIVAVSDALTRLLDFDFKKSEVFLFLIAPPHQKILMLAQALSSVKKEVQEIASSGPTGRLLPGLDAPKGFGVDLTEMKKARAELLSLGDPIAQVTGKFESQKAKIEELVKKYPQLAGVASVALKQITTDFVNSLDEAGRELQKFSNQAAQIRLDSNLLEFPIGPTLEENDKALKAYFATVAEDSGVATSRVIQLRDAIRENTDVMSVFAEQAARNIQDAFAQVFLDFDKGVKGMLESFLNAIAQMAAQAASAQILSSIFGPSVGGSSGLGSFLGGLFGGGAAAAGGAGVPMMAGGGHLMAGEAAIVGEKGPELFVPGASGNVVPNSAMGNVTYAPTINAEGADASLRAALPGILAEDKRRFLKHLQDQMSRGAI